MEPIVLYGGQLYCDITLEVLSSFKVDPGLVGFDRAAAIYFQLFSEKRRMR